MHIWCIGLSNGPFLFPTIFQALNRILSYATSAMRSEKEHLLTPETLSLHYFAFCCYFP